MFHVSPTLRSTHSRRRRPTRPLAESLEGRLLLTAGDLDTSFGTGGYVLVTSNTKPKSTSYDLATSVQVLTDEKILVSGLRNGAGGFVATRRNSNGTVDTSFGTNGFVTTSIANTTERALDMAVMSDGRFVLVGEVYMGGTRSSDYDVAVARYLANGQLDPSFDVDGKVTTSVSMTTASGYRNKQDRGHVVALQGDKVVVGGFTYDGPSLGHDSLLVRYNSNGSRDNTFGLNGTVVTQRPGDDRVSGLLIQDDGKIVVAGSLWNTTAYSVYVARYNANGTPDTTFGSDGTGTVVTPFTSSTDTLDYPSIAKIGLALLGDKIVLATSTLNANANYDLAVARFHPDGSLDNSFSGDGHVTVDLGYAEKGYGLAIQADGKILVAGQMNLDSLLVRLNSDGTLDNLFGNGHPLAPPGVAINSFTSGNEEWLMDLSLQLNGNIVAVGQARTDTNDGSKMVIARYLGDPAPPSVADTASTPLDRSLVRAQTRPALAKAQAYLGADGDDVSRLGPIDLAIADLGGARLAESSGSTITLDDNAAGWGWNTVRGRKAAGRINLRTVAPFSSTRSVT